MYLFLIAHEEKKIKFLPFEVFMHLFQLGLPYWQEMWVQSLGQEDPLEKEMETHSSILAWEIPMDREAWWATVHGVARAGYNVATKTTATIQLKNEIKSLF